MSLSKLVSPVARNICCTEAYLMGMGTFRAILDTAARKLATEKRLNLSLFGSFSVLDEASTETGKGVHISFRPAPKLTRLIEETPTGKTPSLLKEVSEYCDMTQTFTKEILDSFQQEICAALVKKGKFTIQQLGTFLVTNSETPSETMSSKVRFRPKPYLKDLLSTLTDQQVNEMATARERKRARRKKASVSSGTLDRKRLARVRKLLRSRVPENVAMAMMVLEQIALPDDYRAVFETSGLVERLLRADSADVVDSVAKIVAGTENESIRDQFWTLIGLKGKGDSSSELQIGYQSREWISSTTLEEFLGETRNQSITSFQCNYCSNLSEVRLAGLSQLIQVDLSYSGITTLELENLPALENATMYSCQQLCELSLSGLDNLETLNLNACSIVSLPEEIGALRSLRKLSLSGNPLEALPDSIGQLSQLETLDLGETSLAELPESIGGLVNLQNLNLSESRLVELPASIGGLAALRELDLSSTGIESLPGTIGQLKSLKKLVLPSEIKEAPRELGQLPGLRELYFGSSYRSDESTTTRIILDLCRQLDAAGPRDSVDSG